MSWGPWASPLDGAERLARLRCLQSLVSVFAGPAGQDAVRALRQAETDPDALPRALALFDRLPSRPRRNALATYAALHRPRGDRT